MVAINHNLKKDLAGNSLAPDQGNPDSGSGPRKSSVEEMRKLLGPLVSPLLCDATGALDLSKIPVKDFEEFKKFLITQVKVDGISFNEYAFASYHKILGKEEYRPLLEELFFLASQPLTPAPLPQGGEGDQSSRLAPQSGERGRGEGHTDLLQKLTAEIISVSAQKFVSTHIQSDPGRQRLRSILSDKETYTKEIRADVAKAVAQLGYEMGGSAASLQEFHRRISWLNYGNIKINDEEMKQAVYWANDILKQVANQQNDSSQLQTRHLSDPGSVPRFPGLERELKRKITNEEIQKKAKFALDNEKATNPLNQMQGLLAKFWLLVVDGDQWQESNAHKRSVNAAFLIQETERLLKAGENIQNEEAFLKWNESIRDFLLGGLQVRGEGLERDIKDFVSTKTVADMLAPLSQSHRAPYEDLKKIVDEIHHAADMGEKVYFPPSAKSEGAFQEVQAQFLSGLRQAKRSLWYGYKQHRGTSRAISNVASWMGYGDIEEIKKGQDALDGLIKKVSEAKDVKQMEEALQELQGQLKEDGLLHGALRASEMEGYEQILGVVQTIGILLGSRLILKGIVKPAAAATSAANTLPVRAAKAFGIGFYLSGAENIVAASTGEVRPNGEHLSHWFWDSTATAVSMMLTAPLASYMGPDPISSSIVKRTIATYGSGWLRFPLHVGADLGLETAEEWINAFVRARMDDSNAMIGKDQARDIAMVTGFGGGFLQMRSLGEILKVRRGPTTSSQTGRSDPPDSGSEPDQTPLVSYAKPISMDETPLVRPVESISSEETPLVPAVQDNTIEEEDGEERPSDRPTAIFDSMAYRARSVMPSLDAPANEEWLNQDEAVLEDEEETSEPIDETDTVEDAELLSDPPPSSESESTPDPIVESPADPSPEPGIVPILEPSPGFVPSPPSESLPAFSTQTPMDGRHEELQRELDEAKIKLAQSEGAKGAAQWLANEARQEAADREGTILRMEMDRLSATKAFEETTSLLNQTNQDLQSNLQDQIGRLALAQRQLQLQEAERQGEVLGLQWKARWEAGEFEEQFAQVRKLITELEEINGGLEKVNTELESQVELQGTNIAHLEEVNHSLDRDKTELESKVEIRDTTIDHLRKIGEQLTQQRDSEQARTQQKIVYIKRLESLVEKLENMLQLKKEELEVAQRRYGDLSQHSDWEKQKAQGRYEAADQRLSKEKLRSATLEGEIDGLRNIIRQAHEQAKKKDKKIKELNGEIRKIKIGAEQSKKTQLDQLEKQRQNLEEEKAQLLGQSSRQETRLAELQEQLASGGKVVQSLFEAIALQRDAFLKKAREYTELKTRFGELEREVKSLRKIEDMHDVTKDRLLGQLQENKSLHDQLLSIRNQSREIITGLRRDLREAQNNIKSLEEQIRKSETSAKLVEDELSKIETELAQAEKQLADLRREQGNKTFQIDYSTRREKILLGRIEALKLEISRGKEKLDTQRTQAIEMRRDRRIAVVQQKSLEMNLTRTQAALTQAKDTIVTLRAQDSSQRSELARFGREAEKNQTAWFDARRAKEQLLGKTRLAEDQKNKLDVQSAQIASLEDTLREREITFNNDLRQFNEEKELLIQELEGAKEEVENLRQIEERQAERIQELSESPKAATVPPPLSQASGQDLASDLPPVTVRILEMGSHPPELRRNHTPPMTPTVNDMGNDLRLARHELDIANRLRIAAEQKVKDIEDELAKKQHELTQQISALKNILANRGPAFFQNKDPRRVKVEAKINIGQTFTDKKGELIGRARIIAGGQEGFILPITTSDGSTISAKTTKGIPKRHQGGNEDSFYVAHFTLKLNGEVVEVKIAAGVDGAGGEKRGDLATVFLQGVHALVAEKALKGEVPYPKELFEAGREAVDAQHDFHQIPRDPNSQVTGAGIIGVAVGDQMMFASGGDAGALHTPKMPNGSYQTQGYTNFDVMPAYNLITNGVHLRMVHKADEDFEDIKDGELYYKNAPPPRLYGVKNVPPGTTFTFASDGFFKMMDMVFSDRSNFTGSMEWQASRSQRGYLLRKNFQLFDLNLEAADGREEKDKADYLHDSALGNMKSPGQKFVFKNETLFFPAREENDNLFVIALEQGPKVPRSSFQIPAEYLPLEKVYEVPPAPLLRYLNVAQTESVPLIQKYTSALHQLYGSKVGPVVAQSLANLYRNIPSLEETFNPNLMAQADTKAMKDLLDRLETTVLTHPEVKAGDNKSFMEKAREDVKKIREAARPFQETSPEEVVAILEKYKEWLSQLFPNQIVAAAKNFSEIYKNFPVIEGKINPQTLAALDSDQRRRAFIIIQGTLSPDKARATDREQMEGVQKAVNSIRSLHENSPAPSGNFTPFTSTEAGQFDEYSPKSEEPRSRFSPESVPPPGSMPIYKTSFTYEKGQGRIALGRIHIADPLLSELHIELMDYEESWWVRDLGSERGAWLDGMEIHKPRPGDQNLRPQGEFYELKDGGVLRIGSTYLKATMNRIGDRIGKLTLNKISERASGFPGPSFRPVLEEDKLRMRGAQMVEIVKNSKKPDVYDDKKAPGFFTIVIEQKGLFEKSKKYLTIIRQMDQFWVQNQEAEKVTVRPGEENETSLNRQEQVQIYPGDWIQFNGHKIQFILD